MNIVKSSNGNEPANPAGIIDNLRLQVEILKSDLDDLRTERNLYKKLFEEEIKLQYSQNPCLIKKKRNPAFVNWLKYKGSQA